MSAVVRPAAALPQAPRSLQPWRALARFARTFVRAQRAAVLAERCVKEPEVRREALLAEIRAMVSSYG